MTESICGRSSSCLVLCPRADERCLPPPVELCLLFKQALCRAAHPLWQSLYWGPPLCLSACKLPPTKHSRVFLWAPFFFLSFFLFFFSVWTIVTQRDFFLCLFSSAGTLSVFCSRQDKSCWMVCVDNSPAQRSSAPLSLCVCVLAQNTHLLYTFCFRHLIAYAYLSQYVPL